MPLRPIVRVRELQWLWLFLAILCVDGGVYLSGRLGNESYEYILPDAPVPFNDIVLKSAVSAPILCKQNLYKFSTQPLPREYVLLCNVSIGADGIEHDCDVELCRNASVIIGYPSLYFNTPGKIYFMVTDPPLMGPFVELSHKDYLNLMNHLIWSNWTMNVTVYPDGINPWIRAFSNPALRAIQYIFCFLNIVVIIGCTYCLYLQIKFPLLSHLVLSIEIITSLIRFITYAIDPAFSRLIFPFDVAIVLFTITIPFTLSSSLLIGLYWYGTLNKKIMKDSVLFERKYIFLCSLCISLLFVFEISEDIARVSVGLRPSVVLLQKALAGIFFIVTASIFGFYIFTGVKVIQFLEHSVATKAKPSKALLKIKTLIKVICVIVFIILISHIFFLTEWYDSTIGYCWIWFGGAYFYVALSFAHIFVFWPKTVKKESK